MEVRLLGTVELWAQARRFDVGPPQRRAVLAALAVDAGRPVLTETLIDRIWGERPPAQPRAAIHAHITGVRRVLRQVNAAEQSRRQAGLVRRGDGYVLQTDPQRVDLLKFRDLVAAAAAAQCADAEQVGLLESALQLWRGDALADVPGEWPARMRVAWGLERLDAAVTCARGQLRLGSHEQVIAGVRPLLADYPLAEPLVAALMQALTATGRRAEALDCHTAIRQQLAEELGVDPGAEVQAVHQAILRGELGPQAVATALDAARCTLPADLGVFVGRDKEMDLIATAVTDAAQAVGVIAIHAINGMPGVGKTALAVHIGHRLAERFPDRQLFVDLHAHTTGQPAVQPGDALAHLLAADGVDPRFLPATLDGRAGLWRDRTAQQRLLLVLDNAAGTEQVLPLLPSSPGSLVLVTSRRSLGDLCTAVPVPVDVLAPDDAAAMFVGLAPRAGAHPQAVADLVAACGCLPLAISITASLYQRHQSWTLADLHADVQRTAKGLLTVTAENRTVAAVFDLSYQRLAPARQRFFRLLGLHPGVEIEAYAAAALAGVHLDEAVAHLDELHADHLLGEPGYRRYRMHDLIRVYAHTLTRAADPDSERDQAQGRLLDFYQHTAAHADTWLARLTRPAPTVPAPAAAPELADWDRAAGWLRTERANLLACIHHTTVAGLPARTVGLTAAVASLLRTDGQLTQAADLHQAAATAAQRLGDRHAQAGALHDLADVRLMTNDYPGAADLLAQALDLYCAVGDRRGQANCLTDLGGGVRRMTGDYPGAADLVNQALDLYRGVGDRRGQANTLRESGLLKVTTGDFAGAADLMAQALDLHQALGDLHGQAYDLRELGFIRRTCGDYPAAVDLLGQALDRYRALGDRRGQAITLHELGIVRRLTGDYPAAADLLGRALDLFRLFGSRRGEACALAGLGIVRRLTGDHPGAADLLDRALDLHRALGSRHNEAIASTQLAVVAYQTGDHHAASELLRYALNVFREIGAPDDEAEALNHLGILRRLTGQPDQAHALHHQALAIARRIHYRFEEARALDGIGRAILDLDLDDPATAVAHLTQALHLYRQLGVPEANQTAATLATFVPRAVTDG